MTKYCAINCSQVSSSTATMAINVAVCISSQINLQISAGKVGEASLDKLNAQRKVDVTTETEMKNAKNAVHSTRPKWVETTEAKTQRDKRYETQCKLRWQIFYGAHVAYELRRQKRRHVTRAQQRKPFVERCLFLSVAYLSTRVNSGANSLS